MSRRMGMILVLLLMSFVAMSASDASPRSPRGEASAKLTDANNDVKFDELDPGGTILKGSYGGDIRTVKADVQDKRIVVKVAFDHVQYTRERLNITVAFPAARNGVSYFASMVGNTSTGEPVPSLEQLLADATDSEPVDCAGFQTGIGKDMWIFVVPKSCLRPRSFTRKAMVVKASYTYDTGLATDRFPNVGKASIK